MAYARRSVALLRKSGSVGLNTRHSFALATIWTTLGLDLDFLSEKSVTIRLSCVMARQVV